MGRGGDWPPNSFAEWMVGQNFRSKQPSPSEGQKPIVKVELSEDEASGDETLAVTYPGRRRRAGAAKQAAASASGRKVRFDGDRRPLKSALKKSLSSSSSDATLVETSEDEAATFTEDSSDIDTSEDDAPVRQRKARSKTGKTVSCKKADPDDSSAAKDALPHPTCTCKECVKGRKILKAVIKFEAKTKAAEKAAKNQSKYRNKGRQQGKKNEANDVSDTDGDATDTDATEEENKPSSKDNDTNKNKNKNKKQKRKQKQNISPKEDTSSPAAEPLKIAVNKDVFKLPQYPEEMKPNLIMRPEARVVQIEHALETPYDPRPNAFYDNGKGITRVYHGPQYANPNGKLYANYNSGKVATPRTPAGFPVGAIQNPYAPWVAEGAPLPIPSFGPNLAMYAHVADGEEAMKKAADQGFGLSGLPPPSMPPYFAEMHKEAAQHTDWQKRVSDKRPNKVNSGWSPPKGENAWQKTGSAKGSKKGDAAWSTTPVWGNEKNDKNQNEPGDWGRGGGAAAWVPADTGSKNGSKKAGGTSPHNFGSWGDNNEPKPTFQRTSKDGGSQKHGSQRKWDAGEDNTWGTNNNETGWGAAGDNNGSGGVGDWGSMNNKGKGCGNGSTKAASAGGGYWSNIGDTDNVVWGATSIKNGSGAGGPKPHTSQQINNDQKNTWGGPPGSFPRSAHKSRPGSNAGGNDGARGSKVHHSNGKGGESYHSGPNERFKGAFDWPAGSDPPPGAYNGGRTFRSGSKAGWQGWHPANSQFGAFSRSQPGGGNSSGAGFDLHSSMGPSDWTNKPSDQATGPSIPPDWRNPDAAQNTGGKAMNW